MKLDNSMKLNVFTNHAILTLCIGHVLGHKSLFWSIGTCVNVGSSASFLSVPFIDSTAYLRMANKNGWPMWLFHTGNIILHVLPCIFSIALPPQNMHIWHGFVAILYHLLWTLTTQDGTIFLNKTYVSMQNYQWVKLWQVTIFTELLWTFANCSLVKLLFL